MVVVSSIKTFLKKKKRHLACWASFGDLTCRASIGYQNQREHKVRYFNKLLGKRGHQQRMCCVWAILERE